MLVREGQVPDAAHAIASRPDVIELSRYSRTLRRFYDAFPADQVRAYTYDYVRDSPHGFVDRILAWLELPIEELDIGRVTEQHHVGQQMEMEPRVYQSLRVALADEYEELSEYLPTATATWRNRHYRQAGRALSTSVDVLRD